MDTGKEALKIARNLIKVGLVNSRDTNKGTVKVLFPDKDNTVSNDLPILSCVNMPNVGEQVLCLFLGNGLEEGFCLGSFYSQVNLPPVE
jgi:phage baseplate assembly protein gpV